MGLPTLPGLLKSPTPRFPDSPTHKTPKTMRHVLRSTVMVLACCALACSAAELQPADAQVAEQLLPEQVERIEEAVRAVMEEHKVTGLQVAVGLGEAVVWTEGFGMADLEHEVPVTRSTRFRTASISKWMTATAAMKLVEAGTLDLDAPVQQYCPAFPEKRWTVTTRYLLMHRAGVRHYWGANNEPRTTPAHREALQRSRMEERQGMTSRYTDVIAPLDRFKNDTLLFEPGTQFRYTSHGYRLVGCVLQGAAGTPYRALMDDLIFEPAAMTHTRDDDAFALIPERARGYTRTPGGELSRSRFRDVSENLPAGGHVSTAADLVRFALAFHNDGLVSPESRAQMTAPPPGAEQEDAYYGFGVNVAKVPELGDDTVLNHSGGQDETRTFLILYPQGRLAVATMTNYEPFGGNAQRELVEQIFAIILDP